MGFESGTSGKLSGLPGQEQAQAVAQPVTLEPEKIVPKTEAEKEVERLKALIRELELVVGSLGLETESERDATGDVAVKERDVELASDDLVRQNISAEKSGLVDRSRLVDSSAAARDAKDWSASLAKHASALQESPALMEKLKELGVEVNPALIQGEIAVNKLASGSLSTARSRAYLNSYIIERVRERKMQVIEEMRGKKLEIPGGREEMIAEVINESGLLRENALKRYAAHLTPNHMLRAGGMLSSVWHVFKDMKTAADAASQYPPAVLEGVMRKVVRETLLDVDGSNLRPAYNESLSILDAIYREAREANKPLKEYLSADEGADDRFSKASGTLGRILDITSRLERAISEYAVLVVEREAQDLPSERLQELNRAISLLSGGIVEKNNMYQYMVSDLK